jgi:ParB family chromosome partitioning protein
MFDANRQSQPQTEVVPMSQQAEHQLLDLDIESVEPDPDQPRKHFDPEALDQLAASLKSQSQLVPILAFHDPGTNKYIILDGERRFRACKIAGLPKIRAEVWPYRPDKNELTIGRLTIDQQRLALDPTEQAAAFKEVMDNNGWSASELGRHIHVAHTTITRALALLTLPEDIRAAVGRKDMPVNIAREIARVTDPETRTTVLSQVQEEKLGATAVQKLVSSVLAKPKGAKRGPKKARVWTFKNVGGFTAQVSVKKVVVTPQKKGTSPEDVLAALEALVLKFRDEVAKLEAKAEAEPKGEEFAAQVAVHQ